MRSGPGPGLSVLIIHGQLHPHHPHKDFAKYDFFQILSIVYVFSPSSFPLVDLRAN